jgi:hypothetical protein
MPSPLLLLAVLSAAAGTGEYQIILEQQLNHLPLSKYQLDGRDAVQMDLHDCNASLQPLACVDQNKTFLKHTVACLRHRHLVSLGH